jgi:hypothetical protein
MTPSLEERAVANDDAARAQSDDSDPASVLPLDEDERGYGTF